MATKIRVLNDSFLNKGCQFGVKDSNNAYVINLKNDALLSQEPEQPIKSVILHLSKYRANKYSKVGYKIGIGLICNGDGC